MSEFRENEVVTINFVKLFEERLAGIPDIVSGSGEIPEVYSRLGFKTIQKEVPVVVFPDKQLGAACAWVSKIEMGDIPHESLRNEVSNFIKNETGSQHTYSGNAVPGYIIKLDGKTYIKLGNFRGKVFETVCGEDWLKNLCSTYGLSGAFIMDYLETFGDKGKSEQSETPEAKPKIETGPADHIRWRQIADNLNMDREIFVVFKRFMEARARRITEGQSTVFDQKSENDIAKAIMNDPDGLY
jgi:hypothetical protein